MTQDAIALRDLEIHTRIGITASERSAPQRLLVTAEFPVDCAAAAAADEPIVDYALVRRDMLDLAKTERNTIERLAEDIAAVLLRNHSLPSVTVEVRKFPFADAREASVRITRP